jgi:hypothetical protein
MPLTGAGIGAAAAGKPIIEFNMANSTQTLFGYGEPQ